MNGIPPKVQNQIAMLQQIQQQLQTVLGQKTQYEMAVREANRALEELAGVAEGDAIFLTVGTVMMQKDRPTVEKNLNEKIETLELRIKSLEKQEKMLQGKFEQLQSQVKQALEGKSPTSSPEAS